jgi:5'-nucleotidase
MAVYMQTLRKAVTEGFCVDRALVTNDDGINAPGLQVLIELASELAREVWVVAPERDQSGAAQSLSLHQPLRVRQLGERCFAVAGTPSDCVLMGAFELLPGKPDLVLSGINRGVNIADAVGFSGTLGAARTAALFDIPAIALSQAWKDSGFVHWDTGREFAPHLIRNLLSQPWPRGALANINFPSVAASDVKGVVNATMNSQSMVAARVERRCDSRNQEYFWLSFQHKYSDVRMPISDVNVLREQAISVSFEERQVTQGLNFGLFSRVARPAYT